MIDKEIPAESAMSAPPQVSNVLGDVPGTPSEGNGDHKSSRPVPAAPAAPPRKERVPWWLKLVLQPVLLLAAAALAIVALGVAQKAGWISAGGGGGGHQGESAGAASVRYICPMMCTPPQGEPGRCPVCAMELVPATADGGSTDAQSVEVNPAARRVANIRTVAVKAAPMVRKVRAIGELRYDEGRLKTIAAYVDGRLERMFADYTGVVVAKGDHLALVYSPLLYSSQVELLSARRLRQDPRTGGSAHQDMYGSARQRLAELGVTEAQLAALEKSGKASSRMYVGAPISGTVIEKLAVEGQYVKTGQPIYRLADLSTVWLMLQLFPEDAAAIRYGQRVEAEVQSLPGRKFAGRVAFIDPTVDPKTRTVGIRVVVPNDEGLLRVGDYARATVNIPLGPSGGPAASVYDPELADKWISPRHPHVVASAAGACPECGVALVPASKYGFTSELAAAGQGMVVPRNAVLMVGQTSIVYVETEPGRFEIRPVVLGPTTGDEVAVLQGLEEGEQVACSGNFLIDSQMQLAGNPSLIDPAKLKPGTESPEDRSATLLAALAELSVADRALAENQRICPVTKMPLGSMGAPPKLDIDGRTVFLCCKGCEGRLRADPQKHLANLQQAPAAAAKDAGSSLPKMELPPIGELEILATESPPTTTDTRSADEDEAAAISAALAQLPPADRTLAQKQRVCPVADMPLGSMGAPIKVDVNGRPVFICCEGCREDLLANPAKYLAKLGMEVAR